MSNIPEDSYNSIAYKSTPTNSKVHQVDSDSPTFGHSTNPATHKKLTDSKIHQQIWGYIFYIKQYPKDLKRYDCNDNCWLKNKENWDAAISAEQCDFSLKSEYIPPDKSKPYACNSSKLADGYIFKILDLNIPISDSHKCRNSLERFH